MKFSIKGLTRIAGESKGIRQRDQIFPLFTSPGDNSKYVSVSDIPVMKTDMMPEGQKHTG
jgi:hypothetical protein